MLDKTKTTPPKIPIVPTNSPQPHLPAGRSPGAAGLVEVDPLPEVRELPALLLALREASTPSREAGPFKKNTWCDVAW